jgi:peroxiredoxin
MPRAMLLAVVVGCAVGHPGPACAADPFEGASPIWSLVHEPAVVRDLDLTADQLARYRDLLDRYDARFFPLRNDPADTVGRDATAVLGELTEELQRLLSKAQLRRLLQIQARVQGTPFLIQPEIAGAMEFTPGQRLEIEQLVDGGLQATAALRERLAQGEERTVLEAEYTRLKEAEVKAVQALLEPRQITAWKQALGPEFALESLGRPTYRAPELIDSGAWINSEPVSLEDLAGRVVVVHFYACGCINCIHNYPVYLDWSRRFRDKDVTIIGIHTPETAAESDAAHVRTQAAEAGFDFPVLIDTDKANWEAWGNSMWPSVYLIDKRGRLRFFWPGELRWQGATGDAWMAERIEELLAER